VKLKAGDNFKIIRSTHWGSGKTFICHKVERQTIEGNRDMPVLDLGEMCIFWARFKYPGKSGWHSVPVDWCVPLGPAEKLPAARGLKAKRGRKKHVRGERKVRPG